MAEAVIACPGCAAKNRLRRSVVDRQPRCGRCRRALPWVVEATDDSFAAALVAPMPVLVDFWAAWCGPCKRVAPTLAALADELAGRLKVVKVDVDRSPRASARFRVRSIPALVLFKNGTAVDSLAGAKPKAELRRWLGPHLAA